MTLYTRTDSNGTVWIGDGVKRRPVPGPDVFAMPRSPSSSRSATP